MKYNWKEYYSQWDVYAAIEEENQTLKDNVEFLHSCLDDRDKSIEIMKEENKKLKEERDMLVLQQMWAVDHLDLLEKDNKKLKNAIGYRKKKADKNQEKANQIDKIMKLPWVMVDWKIDWSKVAVYYCI